MDYGDKKRKKQPAVEVPLPTPTIVPRFGVDDVKGYEYLEENGFVVFKDIASPEEVEKGLGLAWDFIEGLGIGIDRHNIESWDNPDWPNPFGNGIVAGDGIGHSELLWFARGLPTVQKIFSKIWNSEELITSFDGMCYHRPYEYNQTWKTKSNPWYHLDQNGHDRPGKSCVQGFLNFCPAGLHDGGLVVIPRSHTIFNQIFKTRQHLKKRGNWINFTNDKELWRNEIPRAGLKPIVVCAEAGDFVLWDSRVIHCNAPADEPRKIPTDGTILPPRRLVAYVCMTPRSRLRPDIQAIRIACFQTGQTTSHWPEDGSVAPARRNTKKTLYKQPVLTEEQKKLIPLE